MVHDGEGLRALSYQCPIHLKPSTSRQLGTLAPRIWGMDASLVVISAHLLFVKVGCFIVRNSSGIKQSDLEGVARQGLGIQNAWGVG